MTNELNVTQDLLKLAATELANYELQTGLHSGVEAFATDDFTGHDNNVKSLEATIDVHTAEYDLIRQLHRVASDLYHKAIERKQNNEFALSQARQARAKAKALEAERQLEEGIQPDLNNPELQKLINVLETWEHYNRLDDYQIEDIVFTLDRWLRTRAQQADVANIFTRGVINANDTGMGKTVETIAFLWVMRQVDPKCQIIWFTKTSLVKSTSPEANMNWGFPLVPVTGTTAERLTLCQTMASFSNVQPLALIMNYECVNNNDLKRWLDSQRWDFMVIDEVHKLRGGANYTPTQLWTNTKDFKNKSNAWPLMLSGSIINNRARELWAFLNIMDELRFPDVGEFETTMKSGALSPKTLLKVLAPSMFRRTKGEVNIRMPERVVKLHSLTMEDPTLRRVYSEFSAQLLTWLESQEGGKKPLSAKSVLDQLIRLRGLCVAPGYINVLKRFVNPNTGEEYKLVKDPNGKGWIDPITNSWHEHNYDRLETGNPDKLDYVVELANELVMDGEQVVIASSGFKAPLDYISSKLVAPNEKLYGNNTSIGGDIEQRFQSGETRVVLTNLQSGAEGFNLHKNPDRWPGGAEHLIMIDDWYNPELVRQMWDRVWRRGSQNRVIIHLIQFENSVDQFVEAIREGKAVQNSKITESTTLRAGDWIDILKKALGGQ